MTENEAKNEAKNKKVCELLGICWHIERRSKFNPFTGSETWYCDCGEYGECVEGNPDFSTPAGIIQLLELMMARSDWNEFYKWASDSQRILDYNSAGSVFVKLSLLLNKTGLFRDRCLEWLEKETKIDNR